MFTTPPELKLLERDTTGQLAKDDAEQQVTLFVDWLLAISESGCALSRSLDRLAEAFRDVKPGGAKRRHLRAKALARARKSRGH